MTQKCIDCNIEKIQNMRRQNKISLPELIIHELRLKLFIKQNHIEKHIIQQWIDGAVTTAANKKLLAQQRV